MHRHTISVRHAMDGIWYAIESQPNFRIHLSISTAVMIAGFVLKVEPWEWVVLVIAIILGLVVEMINTSIESVVDLITLQKHQQAKIAKDVAAGAMFLYALGATLVATLIFLPKIWLYI